MLREIERKNGKSIFKSSDNHTGTVNFYGVRDTQAVNKPFEQKFAFLKAAREAIGSTAAKS